MAGFYGDPVAVLEIVREGNPRTDSWTGNLGADIDSHGSCSWKFTQEEETVQSLSEMEVSGLLTFWELGESRQEGFEKLVERTAAEGVSVWGGMVFGFVVKTEANRDGSQKLQLCVFSSLCLRDVEEEDNI